MVTKPDAVSDALYSQKSDKGKGAYQVHRKRKRWCSWCRTNTHDTEYCYKKDKNSNKQGRETDPALPICYYCGEEGHKVAEGCPVKQKAEAARKANSNRGPTRPGNKSGENAQMLLTNTPSNSE
jgi:hypothetical protein